jgi:hypothetical protein
MPKKLWLIVVTLVCVFKIGLAVPTPTEATHCSPYLLGDLDNSGGACPSNPPVTGTDITLELYYVFLGTPPPAIAPAFQFCVADLNCDGQLTPADVVSELNYFICILPPCFP